VRPRAGRRRRVIRRTGAIWISGLFLLGFVVALVLILTGGSAAAGRSAYTQAHGMREAATVIWARNMSFRSGSSGSTSWDADMLVRLPHPVGGQAQTTVHVPDKVYYRPGNTVTVLVDAQGPGYAELPGRPYVTRTGILVFSIIVSLLIILSATSFFLSVRSWLRSRRASRVNPASGRA
jgi:hypothetical protein